MVLREILFVCWIAFAKSQELPECRQRCLLKVLSGEICEKACEKAYENNVTSLSQMPHPDPPWQVLSTYFGMKLEWNTYSATPIIYLLEVTRHMDQGSARHINTSDPSLLLPVLEKYHIVSENSFTLSNLIIKAAYSFRIAIVTLNGTSTFSNSSGPYETNSSCSVEPCPVSNLRLRVDIQEMKFKRPIIRTYALWDRPEGFAGSSYSFDLEFFTDSNGRCGDHLTTFYDFGLDQNSNRSSEIAEDGLTPYFGCLYSCDLFDFGVSANPNYPVEAEFFFPHCFQGFCGCDTRHGGIPDDSAHIWVNVQRNGTSAASENSTQVMVTWSTAPWLGLDTSYFRITLNSKKRHCKFHSGHKVATQPNNVVSNYSYMFYDLCEGSEYRIHIQARNSSGCGLVIEEGVDFEAVVPLPTTPTTPTPIDSTSLSSSQTPITFLPGTSPRLGKSESARLAAAITVPLVGLLLGVLLLVFYFRCRRKKAPSGTFRRTPTGLHRTTANGTATHVYMRNFGDTSVSCNSSDRGVLVVDLPQKCADGGLELNPAYVEQRIHEAMQTGEVDDFEFGYHRLELGRVLGKGAFGTVYLADAYGISGDTGRTTVAVKVLKENAREEELDDFRTEIGFMKTIGRHQNVVAMLGCCTLFPPLCLIVEYVPHGDLLRYLRDLRKKFEQENLQRQREDETGKQSSGDSTNAMSSYSKRPLMPSLSDTTVSSRLRVFRKAKPCKTSNVKKVSWCGRRPLCQSNSEPSKKCHRSLDAICFKKFDKFFEQEPGSEERKLQRATGSNSLAKGLAAILPLPKPAVPEEGPYVGRDERESSPGTENPPASPGWTSHTSNCRPQDGALDSSDLQSFAYQIANGMAYLSEKGIVHRDLAARNILVGDDKVLKISDFGLSKEGTYVKNSTGKIPLRWLSTEAMRDRIYSTASDVWAFGIVLWEICTLGGFPYPTINDRDLLTFLMEGNRMEKPSNCTDAIYEIMLACWSRELDSRPSFQSLREILWELEKEDHPYVNVDPSQDFVLPPVGDEANQNLILFSDNTVALDSGKAATPASLTNVPDVKARSTSATAMENRGFRKSLGSDDLVTATEDEEVDEIAV